MNAREWYHFFMTSSKKHPSLFLMQKQVREHIEKNYTTIEQFCWDKGLNKATVSNFLKNKKDFQISTLEKLAKATGKKLSIYLK